MVSNIRDRVKLPSKSTIKDNRRSVKVRNARINNKTVKDSRNVRLQEIITETTREATTEIITTMKNLTHQNHLRRHQNLLKKLSLQRSPSLPRSPSLQKNQGQRANRKANLSRKRSLSQAAVKNKKV